LVTTYIFLEVGSEFVDRKAPETPWSRTGLWETIKLLSKYHEIDYDELLFTTTTFAGDERALNSLIHLNLLRVVEEKESRNDTRALRKVYAFSPLYLTAFKTMTSDPKLSTGMNILLVRSQLDRENSKIQAYEDELKKLGSLVSHTYFGFESEPLAVRQRKKFLEDRMNESNEKVVKLEEEHQKLQKAQAVLYRK